MSYVVLREMAKDKKASHYFSVTEICEIREAFSGFYPAETTEGSVLCDLVQKTLSELSLDPAKLPDSTLMVQPT